MKARIFVARACCDPDLSVEHLYVEYGTQHSDTPQVNTGREGAMGFRLGFFTPPDGTPPVSGLCFWSNIGWFNSDAGPVNLEPDHESHEIYTWGNNFITSSGHRYVPAGLGVNGTDDVFVITSAQIPWGSVEAPVKGSKFYKSWLRRPRDAGEPPWFPSQTPEWTYSLPDVHDPNISNDPENNGIPFDGGLRCWAPEVYHTSNTTYVIGSQDFKDTVTGKAGDVRTMSASSPPTILDTARCRNWWDGQVTPEMILAAGGWGAGLNVFANYTYGLEVANSAESARVIYDTPRGKVYAMNRSIWPYKSANHAAWGGGLHWLPIQHETFIQQYDEIGGQMTLHWSIDFPDITINDPILGQLRTNRWLWIINEPDPPLNLAYLWQTPTAEHWALNADGSRLAVFVSMFGNVPPSFDTPLPWNVTWADVLLILNTADGSVAGHRVIHHRTMTNNVTIDYPRTIGYLHGLPVSGFVLSYFFGDFGGQVEAGLLAINDNGSQRWLILDWFSDYWFVGADYVYVVGHPDIPAYEDFPTPGGGEWIADGAVITATDPATGEAVHFWHGELSSGSVLYSIFGPTHLI